MSATQILLLNFIYLQQSRGIALSARVLLFAVVNRRRRSRAAGGREFQLDVRRCSNFGVLLVAIVMRLNCDLWLDDYALERRLISVDCDAIDCGNAFRAVFPLQVVVMHARHRTVLRLVARATVADVSIAITCIRKRRRR